MYTFEIAPVATVIENEMISTMSKLIGYEAGEGTFTTGGSNGNLMGLLCARDRTIPDAQKLGLQGKQLVAFVSEESHYSTTMAVNTLGIGDDNLIRIKTDENGKIIPELLLDSIVAEKEAGRIPFCVIATAGTTVRGSIDPLEEMAEICRRENLWLHVDAAWGGAALLSPKTKGLLRGIEKADSICWDPHKMMGIQLICSVFIVKKRGTLNGVCSHTDSAHYLLLDDNKDADLGQKSLQCGRRVDALKLWLAWRAKGNDGWAELIERYFYLAQYMASKVKLHPNLQLLFKPSLTNVCIRFTHDDLDANTVDDINKKIRKEIIASGQFMISRSNVDQRPILRPVIANPRINENVINDMIKAIVSIGFSLMPMIEKNNN